MPTQLIKQVTKELSCIYYSSELLLFLSLYDRVISRIFRCAYDFIKPLVDYTAFLEIMRMGISTQQLHRLGNKIV